MVDTADRTGALGLNTADLVVGPTSGKLVAKQVYTSGRSRPKGSGSLGRTEHPGDDDRPFAEARKGTHNALRLLSLHRWAFFVPFSVASCAVFILSLYYPRTYLATTSFERRNDPVLMNLPISAGASSFRYFRSTIVRDLTSIECLSEVVQNLNMIEGPTSAADDAAAARRRRALARSLAGTLKISTISPSEHLDIIRITYTGPDPTIGKTLVDEVKRTYIRRTKAWIHDYLTSQRDYFSREAAEALEAVKTAQREYTRLRLDHPHLDPSNPGAISLKLSQLEIERREQLSRKREYETEMSSLQQLLAFSEPQKAAGQLTANQGYSLAETAVPSGLTLQLSKQISEIHRQIRELKASRGMTDLHPDIQALLTRRRWLEKEIERQGGLDLSAAIANGTLDALLATRTRRADAWSAGGGPGSADRARLLAQITAQKTKLKDVEISLESTEATLTQLRQAKRDVYDMQEEFAAVAAAVSQAKLRHRQFEGTRADIEPAIKAIEQNRLEHFSEGQPARGGSKPVSPKSLTIVLLALLAGVGAGVTFVVLAEIFDHVYRSSGRVARSLGLPMLESIDEIVTPQDRRHLFLRRVVLIPLVVVCFIGLTGLTGSMAYLSLEQPWTYQRLIKIPHAAIRLFAGAPD